MIQLLLQLHKSIGGYQLQSQSRIGGYYQPQLQTQNRVRCVELDDHEDEGDHEDEDEEEIQNRVRWSDSEDEEWDSPHNYEDIRSILPPYRQTEIKLHRGSQFCGTTDDARWFIMAKLEYEGQESPQGQVTLWNPATGFVLWLPPLQTIPCFGKFAEDLARDKNLNISNFVRSVDEIQLDNGKTDVVAAIFGHDQENQVLAFCRKDVFDSHGYDQRDFYKEIEVDMRREIGWKEQKWNRSRKINLLSGGTQPGTFLTPKINLPIPAVPGRGLNVIISGDAIACDCWQNEKSTWDIVSFNLCSNAKISQLDGDRKILLPAGWKDSVSAAAAHAALLAAANACSQYSPYSPDATIFAAQDGTVYLVDTSSSRVPSQMLPLGVEDSGGNSLASPLLSMVLSTFSVLLVARSFFSRLLDKVQATTTKRKPQKSRNSCLLDKVQATKTKRKPRKSRKRKRKEEVVTCREVGKLSVSNKEIGKGSDGTIVLEGVLREDKHCVAIKRLLKTHFDVLPKEVESLRATDAHPNIVRYYFMEEDGDFLYLVLERCTCSLHDLITSFSNYQELLHEDTNNQSLLKQNGYPSPFLIKLMRDVVCGLAHLHKLGILHRDLNPKNVLVQKNGVCCAKLSDMGISKRVPADMSPTSISTGYGSRGWQAPEQLLHEPQTYAVDVFNLGILFYFCLTGGRHPFGERSFELDYHIANNQRDLSLISHIPEAVHLLSSLLNRESTLRPTAVQVLDHPFFWDAETRLSFIRDASYRFHSAHKNQETLLLQALETTAANVFGGGNWSSSLDDLLFKTAGGRQRYDVKKVRSLLRLIRNTTNHSGDFPNNVQSIVGRVADEVDAYFATRYPRLIIEVYQVLYSNCLKEPKFSKYFKSSAQKCFGMAGKGN